jgi:hypothetical protein
VGVRIALWIVAVLTAAVVAGSASGSSSSRPTLRLADVQPLVVAGMSFRPRELVRVQAIGTFGTRAKSVRATALGRFVVRFAGLSGDPCKLRFVKATGTDGSRTTLRLPPGACQPEGPGRLAAGVRLRHRAVVERAVERLLVHPGLARDLA